MEDASISKLRSCSDISSSLSSSSSNNGSLYPHEEVFESLQGPLWTQYSIIAQEYKVKVKVKHSCCASDTVRPWLLKLTFLTVVALGLFVCCLELRFSTYSKQKLFLNGGDQILVPTSTYFNEKVSFSIPVNSSNLMQLHVLQDIPDISPNITSYAKGGNFQMMSWTYQYWGLHLLKGTTVKISLCADLHLQFYILKGEKKLKKWTQTIIFADYDFHTSIHPQLHCNKASSFKSHILTVRESDVYYLSFASSVGWRFLTNISAVLQFNRTYYDLSGIKYSCWLNDKNCFANLKYSSKDVSMIHAQSSESDEVADAFDTTEIYFLPFPRWSFYIKLFGGVYAIVVAVTILYTLWRCCVNRFCVHEELEKRPILELDKQRKLMYSLRSAGGDLQKNKNWVVISPLQEASSSERLYEVRERNNASLVASLDTTDSGGRESLEESIESQFLRSRNESTREDLLYRNDALINDQQLLDTCMTSAGVSAI